MKQFTGLSAPRGRQGCGDFKIGQNYLGKWLNHRGVFAKLTGLCFHFNRRLVQDQTNRSLLSALVHLIGLVHSICPLVLAEPPGRLILYSSAYGFSVALCRCVHLGTTFVNSDFQSTSYSFSCIITSLLS
jgi:hypothetical protein